MPPTDDDYLTERLRQTRDVASFGSGAGAASGAPSEGTVVERVTEVAGAEHLGGRKVKDRFIRTNGAPAAQASVVKAPAGDPYLDARLKEIQDAAPRLRSAKAEGKSKADVKAEAVDTYRELRRQLGGS
jgi:hypothetical protein